jgi:hypothetical protein
MSISVRFALTWQEYYAAQRFLARRTSGIAAEKFLGVVLLVLGAAIWYTGGLDPYSLSLLAAGIMLSLVPPLLRRLALKRKWAREPLHRAEHIISFDEDGISYTQGPVASRLDWGYFQRLIEGRDWFLLTYSGDIFSLIPKRAFASEQVLREFRALAAAKLAS